MDASKVFTLFVLLFIASLFYTTSDKLVIYGFGIMALMTVGLLGIFLVNYEKIVDGFKNSQFGLWMNTGLSRGFWISLLIFFALAIKMIIQVVLQLSRRANNLGSTDLNLSKESMRILSRFRDSYYVFIGLLPILLFSFTFNKELNEMNELNRIPYIKWIYPFIKWIQLAVYLALFIVFFVFADLFTKGEFAKIKNESTTPVKKKVVDDESNKDKRERIGDTSIIRR